MKSIKHIQTLYDLSEALRTVYAFIGETADDAGQDDPEYAEHLSKLEDQLVAIVEELNSKFRMNVLLNPFNMIEFRDTLGKDKLELIKEAMNLYRDHLTVLIEEGQASLKNLSEANETLSNFARVVIGE